MSGLDDILAGKLSELQSEVEIAQAASPPPITDAPPTADAPPDINYRDSRYGTAQDPRYSQAEAYLSQNPDARPSRIARDLGMGRARASRLTEAVAAPAAARWEAAQADPRFQSLADALGDTVAEQRYKEYSSFLKPSSGPDMEGFLRSNAATYKDSAPPPPSYTPVDTFGGVEGSRQTGYAYMPFDDASYQEAKDRYEAATGIPADHFSAFQPPAMSDPVSMDPRFLMGNNPAGPPPGSSQYGSYNEANLHRQTIENRLRDRYTAEDRFPEIGKTTAYKNDLRSDLAQEGLAEPRLRGMAGARQNLAEDWKSEWGKLNYSFAAGELLQGGGKMYAANNSGQYVTPEQQEAAAAGLLPGAGALLGTAVGAALGPGGAWAGGIVGGGLGSVAQGVIGANEQRESYAREASERLAASLGAAADTAGRFKDILEATGASTQAVAQGLASLQASGPGVGMAAIAGAGRSALSEGEFYAADTAATSKFLSSDPALAPLAQTYRTQGELTRGQFQSIASLALAEGDMGEFNAAQMQASRATLNRDVQYQGAAQRLEADKGNFVFAGRHWFNNLAINKWANDTFGDPNDPENVSGVHQGDYIEGAQKQMDDRKRALDAQNDADARKYVSEYADINKGRQNLFDAGLQTKIGEAGFSLAQLRGGGSEVMRGLAPGLAASSHAAMAADQLLIDTDTKLMKGMAADDPTRAAFQNLVNSARADMVGRPIADAQRDRLIFDTEQQEQQANYGFSQSNISLGLVTGRLSGRTNAQLQGQEDILLGGQRVYANQQRQDAANSMLSPAERSAMLAQANVLDANVMQQAYGFKMGGYAQTLGMLDNNAAQAGLGITQAKAFGTPDEVYSAQSREAEALSAKMRELTAEIARGGMTVEDATQKEAQLIQVRGQSVQLAAQQWEDRHAASASNAESDFTLATVGMSRRIRSDGSGAVDFDRVNAGFQEKFRADQEAIDHYAVGDPRHRAGQARLASDQAQARDYEGNLLAYAPSVQLGMEGIAAEDALGRERHAFRREMISPYQSGDPNSDPLTRGAGLDRAIGGSLAFLTKEEADMTGERQRRQGQVGADGRPLWDNLAEQGYQRQMLGFHEQRDSLMDEREQIKHDRNFAMLRALPETIIGGGGTGNSVSSFSFDALSAAYSPNVMMGSWGSPRRPAGVSVPGSMPGNAVEAFQTYSGTHQGAAGQGGSATTLTAAIQNLGHGMNTGRIESLLQQLIAEVGKVTNNTNPRTGGQAGPPRSYGSTALQSQNQSFNSNRPSR